MTVLPKRRVGDRSKSPRLSGRRAMGAFALRSPMPRRWHSPTRLRRGVRYSIPRPSTATAAASRACSSTAREPREDFGAVDRDRSHPASLKPGEKKPADLGENGPPGFAPVFDYTYDGVSRAPGALAPQARPGEDRHRTDPRRGFLTTKDRGVLKNVKTVMDGGFRASTSSQGGRDRLHRRRHQRIDTSLRFIQAGDATTPLAGHALARGRARSTPSCRNA